MNWRTVRYDHEQCYDERGRICGSVLRMTGSSDYVASYDGQVIGSYIDMRNGHIAVERAYRDAHRKPRKPLTRDTAADQKP